MIGPGSDKNALQNEKHWTLSISFVICPPTYWSVKCFFVNLYSERDWKACLRVWGAPKSTNFFSRVIVYIGSIYSARNLKLIVENDWEFNVHLHPYFFGPTSNIQMKKAGFSLARIDSRGGKRKRTVYNFGFYGFEEIWTWTTWLRKYPFIFYTWDAEGRAHLGNWLSSTLAFTAGTGSTDKSRERQLGQTRGGPLGGRTYIQSAGLAAIVGGARHAVLFWVNL